MAIFKESKAKQAIRFHLRNASTALGRPGLTYLGMPAEQALDIIVLGKLLKNVICIAEKESVFDETRRNIASMVLSERKFQTGDVWVYLREKYPNESLVADVTFLDFYGGGIRKEDPFAAEIAGLRSYFAKHANYPGRAFVFA